MTDPASDFTDAERRVIAMFIHRTPSWLDGAFYYAAFILPSFLFAAYAVVSGNCRVLLLAYITLLSVAVMYLLYSGPTQRALYSALRKYESRVRALESGREPSR
jgi:hypothetical protein